MARPRHPGLTENELDVMKTLWTKAPLKVGEILERIDRKPRPAYTSLLTLLQTMERKGYVSHEQDGKAYAYFPKFEQRSFVNKEIHRISKRLFNGGPLSLVMSLVKDEHLTQEEIRQLRQLMEEK